MKAQTIFHRRPEGKRSAKPITAFALSLMLLLFSGCAAVGGGISQMQNAEEEATNAEETTNEPRTTRTDDGEATTGEAAATSVAADDAVVTTGDGSVVVRAGDAEVTTGPGGAVARAGDVVAEPDAGSPEANGGEQSVAGRAILRLAGDPGTSFSGACVAGGEPDALEGETPARLDYDMNGAGLACDIEKRGPGNLRVVLTVGDNEVVRETNAEDATISLVYRGGNIVASQSSNSVSSSSVSSNSSVQSQSSNSSINQSVSVTN